jgi:hypothetical protein
LTGGTLLEVLVAISIFMFALGSMFVLFQKSYQSFHFLEQRQSVQSQVLRISSALEADFRVTHFNSVGVENDQILVAGQSLRRDRVCCLSVNDWLDVANFDLATGIPRWNQYIVYLSGLEENGSLERVVFRPDAVALTGLPAVALGDLASLSPSRIRGRQKLCDNVHAFECSLDLSRKLVTQTLRLRRKGARRGLDEKAVEESFEARFQWMPKNTVPKL